MAVAITAQLAVYGARSDSGAVFTSGNVGAEPAEIIMLLTGAKMDTGFILGSAPAIKWWLE